MVINTMAFYPMQVQKLPSSVHKALDKCVRCCVWGSSEEKRAMHLVSWDVLCRPKERGEVGLRKADIMNKALLAKLAWRLLHEDTTIWSRLIRSKYGVSLDGPPLFKHKLRASVVWRGLEWALELLQLGVRWEVRDGRRVRFGADHWLHTGLHSVPRNEAESALDNSFTVSDLWEVGAGWKWDMIGASLPASTLFCLSSTILSPNNLEKDAMHWKSLHGAFSVKTAYALGVGETIEGQREVWRRIWRLRVQKRVKVFHVDGSTQSYPH